ncbi:MAG: S8 family serine peptidase, partial [Mariniblastus sp.]|nr:S8 family serine peptidase [Mariniblastus sp.]
LGTTGIAYNAQIVPIWYLAPPEDGLPTTTDDELLPTNADQAEADSITYEVDEIDIYNHSWGPDDNRQVEGPLELTTQALRDSVFFGRGGLGNIHVFAAGNGAYEGLDENNEPAIARDFAGYDGYVSSRYTIGVTGYDHDGLYANVDGTITNFAEVGPSVLVAAPTGSFYQEIGSDTGIGSGIWTADFTGDYGGNLEPLPSGLETDDYFPDTDYTSRMNGTSASAPMVSGVIALMLQANPNLSWRDVQEILVRSSEQIAQFEIPGTGAGNTGDDRYVGKNSWTVNPAQLFRDQDIRMYGSGDRAQISHLLQEQSQTDPKWRVSGDPVATGLESRTFHAPPSPLLFANAAGYTVSHGRGVFGEDFGYGHGGVDAEMAVALAQKWTATGQTLLPEKTWTTFTQTASLEVGGSETLELGDPDSDLELGEMLVPGRLPGRDEFPDGFFGENGDDSPLAELAETGYADGFLTVKVPDSELMTVETVEVRLKIADGTDALNYTAINLVSPGGTHSQLNSFYDLTDDTDIDTLQHPSWPGVAVSELDDITAGEEFNWTFATNRAWGERSDAALVLNPATGEPFLQEALLAKLDATQSSTALPEETGMRTWELHLQNFSGSELTADEVEVIFHGNPLPAGSMRIQGAVGLDQNQDGDFNFDRYLQNTQLTAPELDLDTDGTTNRQSEITRIGDVNQEPFAGNMTVELLSTGNSCSEIHEFITGHDGNFYFDVVPGHYTLRVVDPLGRDLLSESGGAAGTLPRFQQQWQITPEWFYAGQKEVEIFQAQDGMGNLLDFERIRTVDNNTGTPAAWSHPDLGTPLADHVRGINFLVDGGPPPSGSTQVGSGPGTTTGTGLVYADLAGNGQLDGFDVGAGRVTVYADLNNNGQYDPLFDPSAETLSDGTYQLEVPFDTGSVNVGVVLPTGWTHTSECGPFQSVTINPAQPIIQVDFALMPPVDSGTSGTSAPGRILGSVFLDSNGNGNLDASETGAAGASLYLDTNLDGNLDPGEPQTVTGPGGGYAFDSVDPGTLHVRLNLSDTSLVTAPASAMYAVMMVGDGTFSNLHFGLEAVEQRDYGDLGGDFPTLATENGPSHLVAHGFSIGQNVTGEFDGKPAANANGDNYDDGVQLVNWVGSPVDGEGNPIELVVGSNILQIELKGSGGRLNGWMDFNGNQAFDPGEQIFTNRDLTAGTHMLAFDVPSLPASGADVAARFRWGEANLSYTGGSNSAGEVEDYMLGNSLVPAVAGDFDGNRVADDGDYDVWKSTFGSTTDLRADGNGDGVVDAADWTIWADNRQLGTTSSSSNGPSTNTSTSASRSLAAPNHGASSPHNQP